MDVDGHKYRASYCRYIRYQENDRRLNVGVTQYESNAEIKEEALTNDGESWPPRTFAKVELFWTQKGAVAGTGGGKGAKRHCRIEDSEVKEFAPFSCVKRMNKAVALLDFTGVPVMSAIVCDRLRIVAKYRSHVFRLSRSAQNSQNQRRRIRQGTAAATVVHVGDDGQEDLTVVHPQLTVVAPNGVDSYKRSVRYDTTLSGRVWCRTGTVGLTFCCHA